jgi:hypothetical protein
MNIAQQLPEPLTSFIIDVPAHHYYDFELSPESTYPLRGVTYPVDYGHINGYTAEDGHELDLFVGNSADGLAGVVLVDRGTNTPNEHKFYVALSAEEVTGIISQLKPVLISHQELATTKDLLANIEQFKDPDNPSRA